MAQASAGNVIAALASFFIPGLGQLLQGRVLAALGFFVFTLLFWLILMGWAVHLWSIIDAALFTREDRYERYDRRRHYDDRRYDRAYRRGYY